ncbi:MAG TPA: transcriptional repressor, partial [Pyrinomonadaceae bacterium]|nr:transcriptional repressor [Pyrinomonadaceae bacterium]
MNTTSIKELGLTKQREVVLQVIRDAHEHLTANEVFTAAKGLLPTISFATVYNSLRYLKQSGHI